MTQVEEKWNLYRTITRGHQTYVIYNHAIKDVINEWAYDYSLDVRLTIKEPGVNGVGLTEIEYREVIALEQILIGQMAEVDCLYVGRITTQGFVFYTFYTNTNESTLNERVSLIESRGDYELASSYNHDPDRDSYWNYLFPTKRDLRVIQDKEIVDALVEQGDMLKQARRIDHLAFFDSENDVKKFCNWLKGNKFKVKEYVGLGKIKDKFQLSFYQAEAIPLPNETNPITIKLLEKAKQFNGDYDGWSACVITT